MADETFKVDTADVLAVDAAVARSTGAAGYGVTDTGFVPKPFARLLAEKLALARSLFGNDLDLGSGSAIRKLLEVSALEDARTWAAMASLYDNQFVATARGEALSRLGEELGLPRPYLEARGTVRLTANLPASFDFLTLPQGARLLTSGFHHVALEESVLLSRSSPVREVPVVAFYPGPEHNLNPAVETQKIRFWNTLDAKLSWTPGDLLSIARVQVPNVAPEAIVAIEHTAPLTGGEQQWPDVRYRELLLQAPRSLWTVESIRVALSMLPGVRQVQVRDRVGGLDVNLPIFGSFNFLERLFGSERDLASPYYFDVVVATTDAAIWDGPDGLGAALASAMEDLRPIGIGARLQQADRVFVGLSGRLVVKGLPLPRTGQLDAVNTSAAAVALKQRLMQRVRRYVDALGFGEPVRASEVVWAMMSEPGVADVQNLQLLRFPPGYGDNSVSQPPALVDFFQAPVGQNVLVRANQIASFVDSDLMLRIV
ncbi:baseplate J/gp47 family protein [Myxococcus sp. RHSTA-1-4]|uniref:baseplate J/gp47 family protein n=1 Tax=Myxococcus sp. RHSTA-1-4 TaxID=2874601 RepID=UPI001CBB1F0E|nr:baseplate J/gp47 family protein [Myxococcus sp. RHSTA-1-4]MBZ4422793.1 baseplate J/gp47 family protein [Myxococcus sp. RHSTA-1-4]